jgi:hypothetical protein
MRHRRRFGAILAVVVLSAVAASTAASAHRVGGFARVPTTGALKVAASITPAVLPKDRLLPVRLALSISASGESRRVPSGIGRLAWFSDGRFDLQDIPACNPYLQHNGFEECRRSMIGSGSAEIRSEMTGEVRSTVAGITVYNGSKRPSGHRLLFAALRMSQPTTGLLVLPIDVSPLPHARTKATVDVPAIAAGSATLTRLHLSFKRLVSTRDGTKPVYVVNCPATRHSFALRGAVRFLDGSTASDSVARRCTASHSG